MNLYRIKWTKQREDAANAADAALRVARRNNKSSFVAIIVSLTNNKSSATPSWEHNAYTTHKPTNRSPPTCFYWMENAGFAQGSVRVTQAQAGGWWSCTLNSGCALMPHKRLPINCVNKPKVVNLNDLYLQTPRERRPGCGGGKAALASCACYCWASKIYVIWHNLCMAGLPAP